MKINMIYDLLIFVMQIVDAEYVVIRWIVSNMLSAVRKH